MTTHAAHADALSNYILVNDTCNESNNKFPNKVTSLKGGTEKEQKM